jgi:hypothetical protein
MLVRRKKLLLFYLLEFEQNVRSYARRNIQHNRSGDKTKGDFSLIDLLIIKKYLNESSGKTSCGH